MYGKLQKKVLLLMAGPLRGEGVKCRAIKEKIVFFNLFFQRSNISTAIKLEGGEGGKALMARPLREELFFCGFPYLKSINNYVSKNYLLR